MNPDRKKEKENTSDLTQELETKGAKRLVERDIMKLNVVHKTIITYFFSADFCSSSYNQCFGGWWEDDRDLSGVIPVSEIERPSLANGELSQKILVEKELSEVECRVIC